MVRKEWLTFDANNRTPNRSSVTNLINFISFSYFLVKIFLLTDTMTILLLTEWVF